LVKTSNPLVVPFVGEEDYRVGWDYKRTFYVESHIIPLVRP
jgi:hypothetical protein